MYYYLRLFMTVLDFTRFEHVLSRSSSVVGKQSAPQKLSPTGPFSLHKPANPDVDDIPQIRIICISDTHIKTPSLPSGHLLIHSGDLTVNVTFDELQAQLQWLMSQPHAHKIVIAGNHDLLLDSACGGNFLTRGERTVYLTPKFGSWTFQYPAIRDAWTGRVPDDTDILAVHGPPALYEAKVHGTGYLLREIRRVRPKIVVCGHVHSAYGLAIIHYDETEDAGNKLQRRWRGCSLVGALKQALWRKVATRQGDVRSEETLVNAAISPSALSSDDKNVISIIFHCARVALQKEHIS
ncbi:Metallo-dependent phosphatase-like protein [Aspergillus spectabilis]